MKKIKTYNQLFEIFNFKNFNGCDIKDLKKYLEDGGDIDILVNNIEIITY